MLMHCTYWLLLVICLTACHNDSRSTSVKYTIAPSVKPYYYIKDIPVPEGYTRIAVTEGSYAAYLRNLPLKQDNTVYLFNGRKKVNQAAQFAVLKMDVGDKDLQQCADAAMRLYAEHLYAQKQFDKIRFNLTNGFNCSYTKYAAGYRLAVNGHKTSWVLQSAPDTSYAVFRKYMNLVFNYAGTRSLHAQMKTITIKHLQTGDVFIQTGDPYGHAVTVMDMAVNKTTQDTVFMLSQSYMPAQDIHVLLNPTAAGKTPWFSTSFKDKLYTPEWTFTAKDLKRF